MIIILSRYALTSRVQSIIYILLILEIIFIEKFYLTGKNKYAIYLIIISILAVNLQMPIWIFFLILFLPYIFEILLYLVINKLNLENVIQINCPKNIKKFIILFVIIMISGFISPLLHNSYIFFVKSLNNPIYLITGISEMQITRLINSKDALFVELFFVLCIYLKIAKFSVRDFCMFNGLFVFSLIVQKNIIIFVIIGIYLIYKNINVESVFYFNIKLNINILQIFTIIILSYYSFILVLNKKAKLNNYGVNTYPVEIADFLINNTNYKESKIYTEFSVGSYFMYKGIPVFVDSRAEVYIKEFNGGHDILTDYNKLSEYSTYKEVLDKYEFDYLIVSISNPLYYFVDNDEDYCVIYNKNSYFIFKNIKKNKLLLKKN